MSDHKPVISKIGRAMHFIDADSIVEFQQKVDSSVVCNITIGDELEGDFDIAALGLKRKPNIVDLKKVYYSIYVDADDHLYFRDASDRGSICATTLRMSDVTPHMQVR